MPGNKLVPFVYNCFVFRSLTTAAKVVAVSTFFGVAP